MSPLRRSLLTVVGAAVAVVATLLWVGTIGWVLLAVLAFLIVPGVILGYASRSDR
jgi:hypothetical protein